MVTYDNSKCMQCALCIKTCHEYCISLTDGGIEIDHHLCSTCTQCIAICPNQALSWNNIPAKKINKDMLPTKAQLREFLKARRSERHFTKKKISRELLKEIAMMGKYSPTNNYDMDVIIVDSEEIIQKLGEICLKKSKRLYKLIYKPKIMRWIGKQVSPEYEKAEVKFIESFKRKSFFSEATALIIIIGDPRIRLTELSAQYFLYNMQLYAKTLGIGSRQSNAGKMFLAKDKEAKKLLEIPKGKRIQAMLFCGYPALEYKNKVEGIKPRIYFM
jgi:Fe-S-cluster-containing hydrogenase component 2